MKSIKSFIYRLQLLLFGVFVFSGMVAWADDTPPIRLAIGPFFAPAGNQPLENIAGYLPDLLTASLSQQNQFQLIERNKANAVWSELHLTEAGLTSAETVSRLGAILSCDWLVSGSLVQTATGPQILVKVINIQDSVVSDLQAIPYTTTNLPAAATAIADFLAQARTRTHPREFIALGKFEDMSVSAGREDWSPRLVALIEKRFLAAGYGIVEREAMGPIFSEYQFQSAGLTGDATNHVKLKPAFWIVDGGCKWIHDTEDKLNVTIRFQKMGGREQLFSFTKLPGEAVEKATLDAIDSALASGGSVTEANALAGEERLRDAHLTDLENGRGETAPLHYSTNETFITLTNASGTTRRVRVDPAFLAAQAAHANEGYKTLQQAVLLNPKDMKAKSMLGMSWFGSADPVKNQQGEELLEDVANSGDPNYAARAKNWLDDVKSGRIEFKRDQLGNPQIVVHGQPVSITKAATSTPDPPISASTTAMPASVNGAVIMASPAPSAPVILPSMPVTARSHTDITAARLWGRQIVFAAGTRLWVLDLDSHQLQDINLPVRLKNTISAIEVSHDNLWLGTEKGLVHISVTSGKVRLFGENDGFPTPAITALRLVGGRLFIGFGSQNSGTFGYLDLATEKFSGLMGGVKLHASWAEAVQNPPDVPVVSITTLDGNSFWVATAKALQHLDLASAKWSQAAAGELAQTRALPEYTVAINSQFVAMPDPMACVAIRQTGSAKWIRVALANDDDGNAAYGLATDPANPDYLWIGGSRGKVTLLDVATSKIILQGNLPSPGTVSWIFPVRDQVAFIADGQVPGTQNLICLKRSTLFGGNLDPEGAKPSTEQTLAQLAAPKRDRFLQQNFAKFVPVEFQKTTNGEAVIQQLHVKQNLFEYGDKYYCGFRFTVPTWMDGDFNWLHVTAKSEAQQNMVLYGIEWEILPESGKITGFDQYTWFNLGEYPWLNQQFPYTQNVIIQNLGQDRLEPGKSYAIWFTFQQTDVPDIGFAMTIDSARGAQEFGTLPLR